LLSCKAKHIDSAASHVQYTTSHRGPDVRRSCESLTPPTLRNTESPRLDFFLFIILEIRLALIC
jgi:hypothetical protein